MDENTALIGSPITLAELKSLGKFVRWQDVGTRVADLVAADRLPNGYPIVPSRLPATGFIDLCVNGRWQQVRFLRMAGSLSGGDRRIVYLDEGTERTTPYAWYGVAPAGHYTEWQGLRPETLVGATLLDQFELAQQGHVIHSQALKGEDWPYLTFEVRSFHPKARWVERDDMWIGSYTVHAADPRVRVEGVVPREPWFNTTIAVSHRWLHPDHPDPEDIQFRELMKLSETLNLHDNQAFLIDYCSLPQQPRGPDETVWFREHLPGFQAQFKYVTLVLNAGSADYSTRAWCMFELMLAAMNRTPRPTLLNHNQLAEPLRQARELAENYMKQTGWNQQGMLNAFRGGMNNATFAKWARDPVNVALYNASIDGRCSILEKFENELAVNDPKDRPIILDLLKRLAFEEAEA
jgi:hypothetical protein